MCPSKLWHCVGSVHFDSIKKVGTLILTTIATVKCLRLRYMWTDLENLLVDDAMSPSHLLSYSVNEPLQDAASRIARTAPDYTELTLQKRSILLARRSHKEKKTSKRWKALACSFSEFVNMIIWQIEQCHSREGRLKEEVINNHWRKSEKGDGVSGRKNHRETRILLPLPAKYK